MKRQTLKRIAAVFIAVIMTPTFALTAFADEGVRKNGGYYEVTAAKELTDRTLPCFFANGTSMTSKTYKSEIELTFLDGCADIPYIKLENAASLINDTARRFFGDKKLKVTCSYSNGKCTFKRENGATAVFDSQKDIITFKDHDKFLRPSFVSFNTDGLTSTGASSFGISDYLRCSDEQSYETSGGETRFDLSAYKIHIIENDGVMYLPLQTLSDLFISGLYAGILFNGEMVFVGSSIDEYKEEAKLFYSADTGDRSPELTMFTYQELCLALDTHYGLKEEHGIDSFDSFFRKTGLYKKLTDPSGKKFDDAICELCINCFADFHSVFSDASPYAGRNYDPDLASFNPNVVASLARTTYFSLLRQSYFPNGVPAYQEVGDTAFITIDKFYLPRGGPNYYKTAPTAKAEDTIGIIMYAHSRINRSGSPIKNVVLDLSCNTGGEIDAAVYTVAWFLGYCTVNMENTLTGTRGSITYEADINGDKKFDEKDNLSGKNLYCLISPVTFSAGNMIAALFRETGRVSLIGKSTCGGSCIVQTLTTADGTIFKCSGRYKTGSVVNGSFINTETGVEPDYPIDKIDNFFLRRKLASYINDLF